MAKELVVNFEDINRTIKEYEKSIDDFNDMISSLDRAVDTLKNSEWKSDSATEFFKSYDNGWRENMKKHILIIEHLRKCLEYARNDYEELAYQAEEIRRALDF